jgi:hypothetical protein
MKNFFYYFIFIVCITNKSFSQGLPEINNFKLEDAVENAADDLNESGQFEIPDELQNLMEHPLDINGNEIEILHRFNLLSKSQLENLIAYRIKSGKLIELEELQQVNGFDKKTILAIIPYCTVRKTITYQSVNRFTLRIQKIKNENSDYYSGSDLKILFRYQGTLSHGLKFSFTGEKDAGEEFFSERTKGFDFNSMNLSYSGNRLLRKFIIGDFVLECGQGLTAWTGINLGNGSNLTSIYKSGRGIAPYSGTDENRFFRGVAFSLKRNKFNLDSWFSHHAIDGNFIKDTITREEYITSLQTSGYHRSYSEISDFHSQHETAAGTNLTYSHKKLITGIIFSFQQFEIPVIHNNSPYAKNKFNGTISFNTGIHYSYNFKNILFFGETALDRNNSLVSLNGLIVSVDSRLTIGIVQRTYSPKYINLKSNAFGVNSESNNEEGIFLGINYKLIRSLTYTNYIDIYSFPYLKYRVDKPSIGHDLFNQLEFKPNKKFTAIFRYRTRFSQQNGSTQYRGQNPLNDLNNDNFRFSARFKINDSWEYGCRAEVNTSFVNKNKSASASALSQDVFFKPMGKSYSFNFRYAIFNCPEFNTRIYSYENDVQGAFSIPFYYGTGNRFYLNLNFRLLRQTSIAIRYAFTWTDTEKETLEKPELKIQIKSAF